MKHPSELFLGEQFLKKQEWIDAGVVDRTNEFLEYVKDLPEGEWEYYPNDDDYFELLANGIHELVKKKVQLSDYADPPYNTCGWEISLVKFHNKRKELAIILERYGDFMNSDPTFIVQK